MLRAEIMRLYEKRVFTCFPLMDIACAIGPDQSGLRRQDRAQGGVQKKVAAFGTPTDANPFPKKP